MEPWQRAAAVAQLMKAMGCDVRRSAFITSGLICRTHSAVVDKKDGCQAARDKAEQVAAYASTALRRNRKKKDDGK